MKKTISLFLIALFTITLASCGADDNEVVEDIDFTEVYPENGVYYELFVRSFADSDGDGVGDFNGITEKLDYLVDLGIDGLWLMPIHPSPSY
ncbi:MAG: alpha-amylase family glycosyl hydrolase, partial [Candidatus Izemoplasma sp.]